MFRRLLIIGLVLTLASTVFAEDWKTGDDGLDYDCDVFSALMSGLEAGDIGDMGTDILSRNDKGVEINVFQYVGVMTLFTLQANNDVSVTQDSIFANVVSACASETASGTTSTGEGLFNVVVNDGANIRSCPGTNCSLVRQAKRGEVLVVIGVDGEWYEIQNEDGPAFIADFLVSRGPDAVIDVDEGYSDAELGCVMAFVIKRGDADLSIVLGDEKQSDVVVDLYRPNSNTALTVEGQLDKTFIDTGDPYILQYYAWNTAWPLGTYKIEITLGDQTRMLAWEMKEKGDYTIHIYCA